MKENIFRAWDKQEKELLYSYPKNYKNTNLSVNDLETIAIGTDGELYLLDECGKWDYLNHERFIIEWYIGKQDISGKRVFEGDLFLDCRIYMYVAWYNQFSTYSFFEFGTNEWAGDLGTFDIENMEIIGNIHENPELKNK